MIVAIYDGIPEVVASRSTETLAKHDWHNFLINSNFKVARAKIFESFESGYFTNEDGFELRLFVDKINVLPASEHIYDLFDEAITPEEPGNRIIGSQDHRIKENIEFSIDVVNIATWLSKQKYIIFGYDGNIAGTFLNATNLTYEQITTEKLWEDQYDVEIDANGKINGQLENGWFSAIPIIKIKEI